MKKRRGGVSMVQGASVGGGGGFAFWVGFIDGFCRWIMPRTESLSCAAAGARQWERPDRRPDNHVRTIDFCTAQKLADLPPQGPPTPGTSEVEAASRASFLTSVFFRFFFFILEGRIVVMVDLWPLSGQGVTFDLRAGVVDVAGPFFVCFCFLDAYTRDGTELTFDLGSSGSWTLTCHKKKKTKLLDKINIKIKRLTQVDKLLATLRSWPLTWNQDHCRLHCVQKTK